MEFLKNLPEHPVPASGLLSIRRGQVVSMALSRVDNVQMTMLAFAAGESVSDEAYGGDTLYWVLEGSMPLAISGGERFVLQAGECMAVPAGTLHAIGGEGAFKLMQITVEKP